MAKFIPNWNCHYWVSQQTELTQSKTPPRAITDSIMLSKGTWSIKRYYVLLELYSGPGAGPQKAYQTTIGQGYKGKGNNNEGGFTKLKRLSVRSSYRVLPTKWISLIIFL